MTDQNSTPTPETTAPKAEVVVEPTFLQKVTVKYPRASKAAVIIVGTAAAAGTVLTVNNVRKNKHHLDAAAEHVLEAGHELGQSVSPDPETAA